jgi:hypothetical protein
MANAARSRSVGFCESMTVGFVLYGSSPRNWGWLMTFACQVGKKRTQLCDASLGTASEAMAIGR